MVGFIGLCFLVFGSNAAVSQGSVMAWYLYLTPPPATPPGWVFAPAWAVLYVLMGVAAWRAWCRSERPGPTRLWGWQLLVNALWTPAFFGLHSPTLGLVVILPLLALVLLTIRSFRQVDRPAALLMAPYALWLVFATYLNAGFWWLNAI